MDQMRIGYNIYHICFRFQLLDLNIDIDTDIVGYVELIFISIKIEYRIRIGY